MALVLSTVTPANVAEDGGFLLEIVGEFADHLGQEFEVFIGPNGNDTDASALTGVPGRPRTFYPINSEKIEVYTPILPQGDVSVFVRRKDLSDDDTLVDAIKVFPKDYKTSTYDLRKAWAPIMGTGARKIEEEKALGEAIEETGLLPATIDTIGEADTEIGGLYQTRLTALTPAAVQVPDTYLWGSGGTISSVRQPTELTPGSSWIRLAEDGTPYLVTNVTYIVPNWVITVDAATTVPTPQTLLTGTVTWNGTLTVGMSNPQQVSVGMWIRYGVLDSKWFRITQVSLLSVQIENPWGFTIPSGSVSSYSSINPVSSIVTMGLGVETTLNWPAAGSIALDGLLYRYGSKTLDPPSLDEISYVDGGETILGLRRDHSEGAVVTDITRARNALELTRRAMLVAFANGEDLNAIGRNYGVLRYPFLESDDVFREIVQALAYNPRGTMFGLELALDALVGPGNYILFEDLVNYPCTVFVRLVNDAALTDTSVGKAYLTGREIQDPTSTTTVDIDGTVVDRGAVHSVRLWTEDWYSDFRNQKPSADQIEEISGSPDTVWVYAGPSEAANVILYAGEGVEIDHQASQVSYYDHTSRVLPKSFAVFAAVTRIEVGSVLNTSPTFSNQWGARIEDGAFRVGWGCYQIDATYYALALASGSVLGAATPIILTRGVYYDVEIRKYGESHVELWIDGQLKDRLAYSLFTTSTSSERHLFGISATGAPTTVKGRFRQFRYYTKTDQDFWGYSYGDTQTNSVSGPRHVIMAGAGFVSGDIGKRFTLDGSAIVNGEGGNNNGLYEVDTIVGGTTITVKGSTRVEDATVQTVNPLRVSVSGRLQQFVYPDDLGKELVLSGSAQGNDGTYVIEKLLDPDTLVDLATWATPLRQLTNVCEIVEPTPGFEFVSETGITWRADPDFVTETGLDGHLSDAGSESGGTLTLRQTLPSADTYVGVSYSEVLSALVLLNFSVKNEIVQTLPDVLWAYYPFYLSDPLGFIRAYLDDLTAAGVIPEYSVGD